jgi:hypothetical protein
MRIDLRCNMTIPRALSPNAPRNQHWGHKATARQRAAEEALAAISDAGLLGVTLPTPIHYHVTVGLEKGQKTPDDDNAKANGALKKIRDTFARHLTGDEDKDWHMDSLSMERDPEGRGYIIFTLEVPDGGAED